MFSQWAEIAESGRGVEWARDTHSAMGRFWVPGRYGNYQPEEGAGVVAAVYGGNYSRRRDVKRRYDPENVFRLNQNIAP